MTIKKLGLSVAAATLLTSSLAAGTIATNGNAGLIGSELLSLQDVSLTQALLDINGTGVAKVTYTPTNIPATSLKNPIFKYELSNAKNLVIVDNNISVFEVTTADTNTSLVNYRRVAGNPQISGTNNNVISFNAVSSDIYAYNNKKYIVADANGTDISNAEINATVIKGSTSNVSLTASLYSGDSQALSDSASATVAEVGAEYVGVITTKFDARINAADSFKSFYDQYTTANDADDDTLLFTFDRKETIAGGTLGEATVDVVVEYDQNLTANGYTVTSTAGFTVPPANTNDMNTTGSDELGIDASNVGALAQTAQLDLTIDKVSTLNPTVFTATASVTKSTTVFPIISKTTGNAGAWTIYGYNAQIPNVSGLSTHDTTMKFTNRSSLNTNIYFTLIDPDGTIATLNSVANTELAALPANTTGTYKASALLALVTDADFDKTGSISVEVSIPTTPSSVYGMASFKNVSLGQFKDLPVYNSSTMGY
jgi:hypothetical protein